MFPTLKNNAAASYLARVKIELLKGAGLLEHFSHLPVLYPCQCSVFFVDNSLFS